MLGSVLQKSFPKKFSKLTEKYLCNSLFLTLPTDTLCRIHVDSMWILRRYFEDQFSKNFHVIFAYFFDVILMNEKSMLFPRTFFDVISMVEIDTLFLLTFGDAILMGKNLTSVLVSCKLRKIFEEVFPVFVTLNS